MEASQEGGGREKKPVGLLRVAPARMHARGRKQMHTHTRFYTQGVWKTAPFNERATFALTDARLSVRFLPARCGANSGQIWDINNSLFHEWTVRVNERTDMRVAQYLHLGFWLIWPTVNWPTSKGGLDLGRTSCERKEEPTRRMTSNKRRETKEGKRHEGSE